MPNHTKRNRRRTAERKLRQETMEQRLDRRETEIRASQTTIATRMLENMFKISASRQQSERIERFQRTTKPTIARRGQRGQ
jgi:hypothetical protein